MTAWQGLGNTLTSFLSPTIFLTTALHDVQPQKHCSYELALDTESPSKGPPHPASEGAIPIQEGYEPILHDLKH
jgi:hypothetical protein